MKKLITVGCLLFSALIAAHPAEDGKLKYLNDEVVDYQEIQKQAFKFAPIKNRKDLLKLMNTPTALNLLSPQARQLFVDSLEFRKNGLASFNYQALTDELSEVEIYQVLALFGAQYSLQRQSNFDYQPMASKDYKGYKCAAIATCELAEGFICIGNNCR